MGLGVSTRTAFSLLFPPILDEFGWERGMTAGAFSFGFLVSAILSPFVGRLMDRHGPRVVIEMGVGCMAAGLLLAPLVRQPWHLYATLGVLVGGGANCLGYTGQSLFLPNWFVRRRGLAMSVAFSGVGVGSMLVLPWLQAMIGRAGWRAACWTLGLLVLALLAPLNLLLQAATRGSRAQARRRPLRAHQCCERPDSQCRGRRLGRRGLDARSRHAHRPLLVDRGGDIVCGMFAWYAVQVHQTKYLVEIGFSAHARGVGTGLGESGRHPWPNRAWPCL